jgi:hypothetical protein
LHLESFQNEGKPKVFERRKIMETTRNAMNDLSRGAKQATDRAADKASGIKPVKRSRT